MDGQTFADIEKYGVERWLDELAEELQDEDVSAAGRAAGVYPEAGRQAAAVGHPDDQGSCRADGGDVGLGADLRGRLAAGAVCLPAGTQCPGRRLRRSTTLAERGHTEVVDADLSGYFDSIPHAELMKSVARRVSDRHLLHLIKMWLEAPVEETDERGRKHRTTRNKDMGRGTPQGAPISPLLSNLYMRRFMLGWKTAGTRAAASARRSSTTPTTS